MENDVTEEINDGQNAVPSKSPKVKPNKALPTDRLSFDKQLAVLRAYAAASGISKNAVSNADVEKISGISTSSISICNPFFNDAGLIVREGMKQRPTQAVFDYSHSYQWESDKAAQKLASTLELTWFAHALLPKLSFRQLLKDEAITIFAEESKASLNYRRQLVLLIDYLEVSGLIRVDGNTLSKVQKKPGTHADLDKTNRHEEKKTDIKKEFSPQTDTDNFNIPIPGKSPINISVPKDLDIDDWAMFASMLQIYISRLKKWGSTDIDSAIKKLNSDDV